MNVYGVANLKSYTDIQTKPKATKKEENKSTIPGTPESDEGEEIVDLVELSEKSGMSVEELQKRKEARDALRGVDINDIKMKNPHRNTDEIEAQKERAARYSAIRDKLNAGKKLSSDEKDFLKEYYPDLYKKAMEIEEEARQFEQQLKRAKTKEEAQQLYLQKKQQILSSASKNNSIAAISAAIDEAFKSYSEGKAATFEIPEKKDKEEDK